MAIEGIVGYPGAGKTLYGVHKLLAAKAAGMRCFANLTCGLDPKQWDRVVWKDVVRLQNAFVLLDEAHMWFPARAYSQTTQAELAVFQQHRKAGLELCWIAQHESRIDVALRELTTCIHYIKPIKLPFLKMVNLVITCEGVSNRVLRRRFFWGGRYFGAYFTEERVLGRDEVTDAPLVGVYPNYARYIDEMGRVRIVAIEDVPQGTFPDKLYYRSSVTWGGRMVEYPAGALARPAGWGTDAEKSAAAGGSKPGKKIALGIKS